jgi:tRNA pseudouridine38-40 synthase
MYATSSFKILGPRRPLWKEWVENLHKYTSVPDDQMDEVRNA